MEVIRVHLKESFDVISALQEDFRVYHGGRCVEEGADYVSYKK